MPTNFIFNNGGNNADFSDVFIPVSAFAQGGLWGWGAGVNGQLGDNASFARSSPVQTVASGITWKQVSVGGSGTFNGWAGGIKTDGTLWMWGQGAVLGNNTSNILTPSPVQTISGGTNWKQLCCGYVTTAAIKTDGTLWIWGANGNGELGDNTNVNKSSPVQTISGGANWKQVSGGDFGNCAIKTDGTLWTWGSGAQGALGILSAINVSSPVQTVAGGTNWKQVSGGGLTKAAIKTDGTLWLWGDNSYGQLGNGTTTSVSSPIQTISSGTNWKQVSCGTDHTAAIKTDGTLWLWGNNSDQVFVGPPLFIAEVVTGRIGTGVQILKYSVPVQTVSGGTNWQLVACGSGSTAAIKTDGTLWTWGRNGDGQLGDNTGGTGDENANKSSPVQTVAGGTNWKQVASAGVNTASVKNNF